MSDSSPHIFYEFGPYRVDVQRSLLLREDKPVPLTPKAFRTLLELVSNSGRVLTKEELIERIWPDSFVEEGNLSQNIFILRKAFGEAKGEHRYIVTVPGQGYRFVPEVAEVVGGVNGGGRAVAGRGESIEGSAPAPPSIAVLPFVPVAGGAGSRVLGLGLAYALITKLSSLRSIAVRPTTAVLRYDEAGRDPLAIGRELGVDLLLDGIYQQTSERIRVSVQLVCVAEGATLWAAKFDEDSRDAFAVEDSISEQVARVLAPRLSGDERERLKKAHADSPEAFQTFIRGRYFWNKRTAEGLRKALGYAQQALALDPAYALAYVGLADSYNLLVGHGGLAPKDCFPKAKAAARRALEIDETLAEAYVSLAFVNSRYEWDWPRAEANFRRAIELKPCYPTAHHWYGEALAGLGRFDESVAALRRAQELDPLSLPINTDLAQSLYYARRYDESEAQLAATLEMDRTYFRALILLGLVRWQKGRGEQAVEALAEAVEVSEDDPLPRSVLGYLYGVSGRAREALEAAAELRQLAAQRYVSAYNVSMIFAGLKQEGPAFEWLERAFADRDVWLSWLAVDPRAAWLASSARLAELVKRVGFPYL
jgi:DNA-binding winged helix-turn-helix (wHTH) protein/tetratricopeptide (TPR) repeat protein